jgi:hypothetical protein
MTRVKRTQIQIIPYADGRYFYARYLYLAAYLYAHGLELVHVEKESPEKHLYVFRDAIGREDLVRMFEYGPKAPVDARNYAAALEELKFQEEQADMESPHSHSFKL